MSRSTGSLGALAFAASLCLMALTACSEEPTFEPPKTEECAAGETACGVSCCTTAQLCETASSTCKPKEASPQCQSGETECGEDCCTASEVCEAASSTCKTPELPDQLPRCYSPATFPANAFASDQALEVDADGYEYSANHKVDVGFAQMVRIGLWPLSETTRLIGTFDLADEPFTFAQCERCVLVVAGKTEVDQKHYLASGGSLTITEVSSQRIAGSLSNVRLVEVRINETTYATTKVEGGCELEIPSLAFDYGTPVDPRIEQCFLPESFESTQFTDFIYPYEANAYGNFYRAIEMPDNAPNLELSVEVYEDGIGSFPLAGAEENCASCNHFVIIEAQSAYDGTKIYVSSGGRLVLTEMSEAAMVGRLEDVVLVETEIDGSDFTPVPGGCTTLIESLEFSSRNETHL